MSQISTGHEKRAHSASPLAVSPKEAARLLELGQTRIYTLMRRGVLVSYRDGRTRRITMQSIHDHMARQLAADGARWQQINPRPPQASKARE